MRRVHGELNAVIAHAIDALAAHQPGELFDKLHLVVLNLLADADDLDTILNERDDNDV